MLQGRYSVNAHWYVCLTLLSSYSQVSRSVSGYFRELEMQQSRMEKEEALKLRKIASSIAKEIKHFWDSIQKVRVLDYLGELVPVLMEYRVTHQLLDTINTCSCYLNIECCNPSLVTKSLLSPLSCSIDVTSRRYIV